MRYMTEKLKDQREYYMLNAHPEEYNNCLEYKYKVKGIYEDREIHYNERTKSCCYSYDIMSDGKCYYYKNIIKELGEN